MKTIEERAIQASERYDDQAYSAGLYMGYKEGAEEQKAIDDATLHERFEKVLNGQKWDLIDKACEWLKERVQCGVHPQSAYGFAEEFRKAMEE